jgi:WD40 repeat protein
MVDGSENGRLTAPPLGPLVPEPAGAAAWLNTDPPRRWDFASGAVTHVGEASIVGTGLVAATGRAFRQRGPHAPVVWRDPDGRAGSLRVDGAHHLESVSPNGVWASLRRHDGKARLVLDAATGRRRVMLPTPARVAFADEGRRAVAVHASRGMLRSVALDTGAVDDLPVVAPEGLLLVWAERGGPRAITLDGGGALSLCDLAARTVRPLPCAIHLADLAAEDDVAAGWGRALVWSADGPVVIDLDTLAVGPARSASRGAVVLPGASTRLAQARRGILEVVHLDGERIVHTHDGHGAEVLQLAWSPDGTRLASLAADRRVRVLDVAARDLACEVELDPVQGAWRVAFGADGRELLTLSARKPSSWDARTGVARATWPPLPHDPHLVSVSPDGRELAVASGEQVTFIDLATRAPPATWRGDAAVATSLAHGPDGAAYAVTRAPARGWELVTFSADRRDRAEGHVVRRVSNDAFVVGGSLVHRAPARVTWTDLANGGERSSPLDGEWRLARLLAASPRVAVMLRGNEARLVDSEGGRGDSWRMPRGAERAAFSPDGAMLAVAYADGGVEVFAR